MLIALIDARHARLLKWSEAGGVHTAQQLDHPDFHEEGHEHRRPSMLDNRAGHHEAAVGHENEEFHRRFARQAMEWLKGHLKQQQPQDFKVFAPPTMLGVLRSITSVQVGEVEFLEGDFIKLTPAQLAAHPRIQKLLHARSASATRISG